MIIRLDKWLSHMGKGSRKEVKQWIKEGAVEVNGETALSPKIQIDTERDKVTFREEGIAYQPYFYFLMNKPRGVISATTDRQATVLDLLDGEDRKKGLFPAGRLDKDTTGLLLLTNDGRLAHQLLSPRRKVPKTYLAQLDQPLDSEDVRRFQEGFFLEEEGILTQPARLEILQPSLGRVTIYEGKYHQVKRMFALCGKTVLQLQRLSMGPLALDPALKEGEYRPLRGEEVEELKSYLEKEGEKG